MTSWVLKNLTREALEPVWRRHDISTERMAQALGVSRQALSARARRLGLPSRSKVRRKLCDDALFRRMWLAGVNSSDIAKHFGYSHRSAIGTRAQNLGLPRRTRSQNTGKKGGWVQTISLTEFWELDLRARMEAEAKKQKVLQ